MIEKLQKRFIFITIVSLFIVLLVILGTINFFNIVKFENKSNELIDIIIQNDGILPRKFNKPKDIPPHNRPFKFDYSDETPYQTRYFYTKVYRNNTVSIDIKNIASIGYLEAREISDKVLNSNKVSGYKGIYKFKVVSKFDYDFVVFLDCRQEIVVVTDFAILSFLVGFVALILFSILLITLSKKVIRPFIESSEKQKRFITDAGHELKTPISIVLANTEVIEIYNGESEWTKSIKNQINRLSDLIKGLLTLAKMDESNFKLEVEKFSCSDVVNKLIENFYTLFDSKNIDVHFNVGENIEIIGNRSNFYNLISILLDNSVKYTNYRGHIKIFLVDKDNKIEFLILNSCDENLKGDLEYLFDRFYRIDKSRSRESGGYGIGLSIAKSIVKAHKGKISANGYGKEVQFKVVLPKKF